MTTLPVLPSGASEEITTSSCVAAPGSTETGSGTLYRTSHQSAQPSSG